MSSSNAKILLVDDKPEKLLALEAVLDDLGQQIVRAYSGRDALRCLLNDDFAVILLDVNMPGMDGFETASLIRERQSTRDVPIIFVTAYGDETHIARGYQLGAVDYIHAPVMPEVLRSKVGVFVELFKKSQQIKRQADSLHRRASQLQRLASASVAISSAQSIERMLQVVTDASRDVIGCHQAITLFSDPRPGPRRTKVQPFASYSAKYEEWRSRPLRLDAIIQTVVYRSRAVIRLTESELLEHPDWEIVKQVRIPPIKGGMLAAPLMGRGGSHLGVIYLCDRGDGPFTADDEMIAVQLAQMASIAIENLLFAEEREANRIKDEFLSMLSHELRTPLNAILGWTQLLRVENPSGDIARGLEVIERNAKAQAKLVEDMLDVSRVATGKLRLNRKVMTLGPTIQSAIDAIRPEAEHKHIQLQSIVEESTRQVHGDPDRLQQVIWNLLANSVKFTPNGGRIEVRLDRVGSNLRIRVSDTGRGIAPQFLPHVFDRFQQADSSSTRAHGGLGIGLTIVRQIVELHGGAVSAESSGEGKGATFNVLLPIHNEETAPNQNMAQALARSVMTEPVSERVDPDSNGHPRPPTSLDGLRVLVVDDASDTLEFVAEVLRKVHADVSTATSAAEAVEVFDRTRPQVVISDIAMPERDGYDLLNDLRTLAAKRGMGEIPVIAMTAYARDEDRQRALSAGFRLHLAKPIEPATIVEAVAQAFAEPQATVTANKAD